MKDTLLVLYGSAAAQQEAQMLLENLCGEKNSELLQSTAELRLLLHVSVKESSLIPLLRQSGIQGFRLDDINQRSSRKGSPFSL